MQHDSYIEMGARHRTCQDYTLTGGYNRGAFAILCDGCSGSENTDIGARIMAHSAKTVLESGVLDFQDFGPKTTKIAKACLAPLEHLSNSVLDTTLGLAIGQKTDEETWEAQVAWWGDGITLVQKPNQIEAIRIKYERNAPNYLAFGLDPKREAAYRIKNGGRRSIERITMSTNGTLLKEMTEPQESPDGNQPFTATWKLNKDDCIILSSDGIESFYNTGHQSIAWTKMVPEFCRFKNRKGELLQRRLTFLRRSNERCGIYHNDDISATALLI